MRCTTLFDPNNETNYSPGADPYGPQDYNPQGMQMPQIDIKKYLPMLVGIGVLLIIGFFLLTWVGSQKEIQIALVDTDGNPVTGTLTLTSEDGKTKLDTTPKGKAKLFKVTLFPGEYSAKVIAENYKTLEGETISIDGETDPSTPIKLTLKRNLKATLTTILEVTKIYEGQEIEGKLMIFNEGNEFNLTDITYTATTPLEVKIHPSGITSPLSTGGTANIDFAVTIKAGANLTKTVPASITFRIRGSDIASQRFDITAMPVIRPTEVTMSGGPPVTTVGLTAGADKPKEYTIKFKNTNKLIPLEDLKVTIEPASDYEDTLSWLKISDPDDATIPTEKTLPLIEPGKDQSIKLTINPPITASKGDKFEGLIRLTSPALKDNKEFVISFVVETAKTVDLIFKTSQEVFNISCSKSTGTCTGAKTYATGEAYLENKGNIDIGSVRLSINLEAQETTANCQSYFRLNTTFVEEGIKVGVKRDISFDILNAPESPDIVNEVCVIKWEYNNPIVSSTREWGQQNIKISKKTT